MGLIPFLHALEGLAVPLLKPLPFQDLFLVVGMRVLRVYERERDHVQGMELEITLLNETSQMWDNRTYMFSLSSGLKKKIKT